jgi:hypothetical protein
MNNKPTDDKRMKCLTVRDERGEVIMVSEAMTSEKLQDRKEFLVQSGVEEDRIVAVSKEMGRSLKRSMQS